MNPGSFFPFPVAAVQVSAQRAEPLARELGERGQIIAGEGTLYPLLARLRRNGLVETSWQESKSGPPRRYYRLTSDRELALASFKKQWRASATPSTRSSAKGARSDLQTTAGEADKLVRRYMAQLDAALRESPSRSESPYCWP
jgi:PadR family transcriptional regulator PadR